MQRWREMKRARNQRPPTQNLSRSLFHPTATQPPPLLFSPQGLYCDIRQLVQFIKEAHGNVFRRVALSALLDSAEKITTAKKPDEKEDAKQPGGRRYGRRGGTLPASHPCRLSLIFIYSHFYVPSASLA